MTGPLVVELPPAELHAASGARTTARPRGPVSSAPSIPHREHQLPGDADETDGVRGGGAELTGLMSRDLEVVFMAAYRAWQQRQEQLSIFEASA